MAHRLPAWPNLYAAGLERSEAVWRLRPRDSQ